MKAMEQDAQLKQILFNSADKASAHFTEGVMQEVNRLSGVGVRYRPLVNHKLEKLFLYTFSALIAIILALCWIITLPDLHFNNWAEITTFLNLDSNTILMFIASFWLVFLMNSLIQEKVLSITAGTREMH